MHGANAFDVVNATTIGTPGSAIPSEGSMAMGSDGTDARFLSVTSGGVLNVAAAQTGTWTVTAGTGFPALATDGGANPANGLMVLGSDGTDTYPLLTDNTGALQIGFSGSFPDVATDGAAVPTTGYLAMGTDGTNAQTLSVTSGGVLNVSSVQSGTWSVGLTTTGPVQSTGSAVPSVAMFVGGTDGTNVKALSVTSGGVLNVSAAQSGSWTVAATQSGTWSVGLTTTGPVGTSGSAVPTVAMNVGGTDGTNLRSLSVTSGGVLNVSAAQSGTYTVTVSKGSSLTTKGTITVTTSATLLLASNGSRKGCAWVVNAGSPIYWSDSSSVVAGDVADANGGFLTSLRGQFGLGPLDGYTGAIYGITKTGTAITAVAEW